MATLIRVTAAALTVFTVAAAAATAAVYPPGFSSMVLEAFKGRPLPGLLCLLLCLSLPLTLMLLLPFLHLPFVLIVHALVNALHLAHQCHVHCCAHAAG